MPRLHFNFALTVAALVFAFCASIVGVDGWRTLNARSVQLADGETAANNLARSIAQHAVGTLREIDVVVIGLVDRLEYDETSARSIESIHALLMRYTSAMDQLQRLSVIGPDGRVITSSMRSADNSIDASDRVYFRHHRDSPSRDVFIGPAIRSKSTDEWIVTLSRRFDRPDGSFGGVVLASIDLQYFKHFYETLEIGKSGTLTIALRDGQLLLRRPHREDLVGGSLAKTDIYRNHVSRVSEGTVTQVSTLDQVERQIAFKNLDEYPLYVVAALATSDTLAAWRTDALFHSGISLLLVSGLALCGYWLVVQIGNQAAIRRELLASKKELESVNGRLSTMALEDALTGLMNRREFDRVLANETRRADRCGTSLALILLDVDHFKPYNDRYGHPAGDACLQTISALLAQSARRPGDLVARYGGEEFAIVLPGLDARSAAAVAMKICSDLRALALPHVGSPFGIVTISAGVASIDEVEVRSSAALLARADAELYEAKRAGRNRVDGSAGDQASAREWVAFAF